MTALLEMRGITRSFPGVRALDMVNLRVEASSVHALIGKNGAGKSTLIKILSGVIRPDAGDILMDGGSRHFGSPAAAMSAGVAVVHQELSLVQGLSVAENLFLGRWLRRGGRVDWAAMRAASRAVFTRLDPSIDPDIEVGLLGIAQQQLVEIAKAILREPRVLVLDEPTSALSEADAERLLAIVRDLAEGGVGVVYISHRLAEIEAIADQVTVLRDGRTVGSSPMAALDRPTIVHMMLGEELGSAHETLPAVESEIALQVAHLQRGNALRDVSFTLRRGEILGIAGLVGAGRSELVRAIFGADRLDSGSVVVEGREISRPSPRRMRNLGVAFLPEDRKRQALFLDLSVRENLVLAVLKHLRERLFISRDKERSLVARLIADLQIAAASSDVAVRTLSGGNQQKIVMGKWLAIEPKVLLLDEPTRGIDVQAKAQIFRILGELAKNGLAVIFISSEIEEVLLVSHRVLTMARGRIIADEPTHEADLSRIMLSAAM
jgi:ABC-type sugar transport system ATPase subunit